MLHLQRMTRINFGGCSKPLNRVTSEQAMIICVDSWQEFLLGVSVINCILVDCG